MGVLHLPARNSADHRTGRSVGIAAPHVRGQLLKLAVIAAALLLAVAPLPATLVERMYSGGAYLLFQPVVTTITNRVPFLLLDAGVAGALAALLVFVGRQIHRWRRRRVSSEARAASGGWSGGVATVSNILLVAAVVYLAFEACWGLNYRRTPLTARLDFDRGRVTRTAAIDWLDRAVENLNDGYAPAYRAPWPQARDLPEHLGPAFARAQRFLGARRTATPGLPKRTLLTPYFRWAGIDGVTNPFGLDITINPQVLPAERPFVVAHEWGHLAGLANEAEASFLAWLTCMQGDAQAQYSAWLSVLGHLVGAVPRDERRSIVGALEEGPRRDLAGMAARSRQTLPAVRVVAWQAYDRFLRANRVPEGIASYDLVAELLLGTRFDEKTGTAPVLRKR
ncbi:MAG: DUF3810 family protein [Luteitalea sp.]|nr:DUF3810 family protein [Luteitalea sp.]